MNDPIQHPVLKASSAVAAMVAGWQWGEIAAALAAIYSFLLISEWFWKRLWKPIFLYFGWIKKDES
jgi:hypothetical protein